MTERAGYSSDIESGADGIHTPGGQAPPAADRGPASDAADIASTDMSQVPGSRVDETQPIYGEGRHAEFERELADAKDRHLRLAAEYDNFRRRTAKERSELADRAQATFVARLLDVLDDLDRIVASDPGSTPLGTLREGLAAVDRKLWKELQAAGVERVDPVGERFDPAMHEAVAMTPTPDADRDGTVAATFQVGYRFKGALVRPARVQVYSAQGQA